MPNPASKKSRVQPVKDTPSITAEGRLLGRRIAGLSVTLLRPVEDERGDVTELYRASWGLHPAGVTHVYRATLRPGVVKGWIVHRKQEDRLAVVEGTLTWAFYDDRPRSRSRGVLSVLTFSERNRALIVIPRGVWHAVKNVGLTDAAFINLPSRAYDHADPDKYRLPLKNDLIPFDFSRPVRG
jgi:dTDP-4-dehydrorhamnose 3,5-epimerase